MFFLYLLAEGTCGGSWASGSDLSHCYVFSRVRYDVSFCHHMPTVAKAHGDVSSVGGDVGELLAGFFKFYAFDFSWENHVVAIRRPPAKLVKQHADKLMPRPRQVGAHSCQNSVAG